MKSWRMSNKRQRCAHTCLSSYRAVCLDYFWQLLSVSNTRLTLQNEVRTQRNCVISATRPDVCHLLHKTYERVNNEVWGELQTFNPSVPRASAVGKWPAKMQCNAPAEESHHNRKNSQNRASKTSNHFHCRRMTSTLSHKQDNSKRNTSAILHTFIFSHCIHALTGNRTPDLGIAGAVLYSLWKYW